MAIILDMHVLIILPYWVERASSSFCPASATNSCQKFLSAAATVLCPVRYPRTRQESAAIDFLGIFPRENKKNSWIIYSSNLQLSSADKRCTYHHDHHHYFHSMTITWLALLKYQFLCVKDWCYESNAGYYFLYFV